MQTQPQNAEVEHKLEPEQLANNFCHALREALGDEAVQRINHLNSLPEFAGCCASHELCDPNQIMLEVLSETGLGIGDRVIFEFVDRAWAIARQNEFKCTCC